jgi:hypothetical protein
MAYIGQEPGQGQAERFIFTASGGETVVSADDSGLSLGYTENQVSVYLNGVKLVVGAGKDCQATNGSTITGLSALTASDVVEVIALSSFSPADTVPKSGGTFTGNVIMGANLTVSGTTTTIDTAVTVSDAMVINNAGSDVGIKVNSTSTGNIMQLQDNATDVLVVADGGDISTGTNNKIKQKGAFMQSSTHQSLVLGG